MNRKHLFEREILFIINVFITFDQFNACLLNENINFFKKHITNFKLLYGSVFIFISTVLFLCDLFSRKYHNTIL